MKHDLEVQINPYRGKCRVRLSLLSNWLDALEAAPHGELQSQVASCSCTGYTQLQPHLTYFTFFPFFRRCIDTVKELLEFRLCLARHRADQTIFHRSL